MANSLFFGLWLLSTWLAGYIGSVHGSIGSIIPESMFNNMLKHRNDAACPGKGFYTYRAFINAANAFPAFGSTGDLTTKKREIAAFLGQTSHETTGKIHAVQGMFPYQIWFKILAATQNYKGTKPCSNHVGSNT